MAKRKYIGSRYAISVIINDEGTWGDCVPFKVDQAGIIACDESLLPVPMATIDLNLTCTDSTSQWNKARVGIVGWPPDILTMLDTLRSQIQEIMQTSEYKGHPHEQNKKVETDSVGEAPETGGVNDK